MLTNGGLETKGMISSGDSPYALPDWRWVPNARRVGTIVLVVASLAGCGKPSLESQNASKQYRPNFVVFLADDVGWDDIGAFGHPTVRTPNIDGLARTGARFMQAFLTTSSCSPTRCSILTGRYPHSAAAAEAHQPLLHDQVTMVEKLKEAGYYTASAGKWHLGADATTRFNRVRRGDVGDSSGCGYWVQSFRERPPDRPFFLWLASLDAHLPFEAGTIAPPYSLSDAVVPPFLPDLPEIRDDLNLYSEKITRLDDYVGRVLSEIELQRDVAQHTMVLFLSDNGRPFPRCKTTLYDSGVRTPLIIRLPGVVKPGTVSSSLISVVDIAPTILELAGLPVPGMMQGVSFARVLRDPTAELRPYIVAEQNWHDYAARERAVRTRSFKYIRNFYPDLADTPPADVVRSRTFQIMRKMKDAGLLAPAQMACFIRPRPGEELYDLLADPHELRNLAAVPNHREMLQNLRTILNRWQTETNDIEPPERRPDEYDRERGQPLPGSKAAARMIHVPD